MPSVDPFQTPKAMDLTTLVRDGTDAGRWLLSLGIYELRGDELKIAIRPNQRFQRPKDFASTAENPVLVTILKRAKLRPAPGFVDERKTQTIKGWGTVVDPDGDCRITREDQLTVTVPKTPHNLTYVKKNFVRLNAPRILQEATGDFLLQVNVKAFPPPANNTPSGERLSFRSAGLLVWQDNKNFIRLERAAVDGNAEPFVWLERFQDGKAVTQQTKPIGDKDIDLRVKRTGNTFTFSVRKAASRTMSLPRRSSCQRCCKSGCWPSTRQPNRFRHSWRAEADGEIVCCGSKTCRHGVRLDSRSAKPHAHWIGS